ncbi:MAG TPA: dihydrodipicolinate reductase C-terminal domain-containing protein [Petrotogaceae bacterium]|nr:dihydrodipicolinate reductase C-terminal domain-containing protein [Petrotogaceae bacterium]
MLLKYGLIGSSGKMGKEVIEFFTENGHEMVYSMDINGETMTAEPDILIDFSLAGAFEKTLETAYRLKKPFIMGTTGLTKQNMKDLKKLSKQIPVIYSTNFSIGIQLMICMAEFMKKNTDEWDIGISEIHHRFKKDKPSGTANTICQALGGGIEINSQRLGNIAGEHTVSFASLGEVITITHRALSRRTFAEGVLRSACFLIEKPAGMYTFRQVIVGEGNGNGQL